MHAVSARHHAIPFYVAAPLSTFDEKNLEQDVVIEERGREEMPAMGNRTVVPDAARVKICIRCNAPGPRITAVITENGRVSARHLTSVHSYP
jgi:methylthioribose-1-phosphate isomerase